MAVTKVHPVSYSVLGAVNYITNPDKTDGEIYVSSYACGVHTADLEFAETASKGSKLGDVKAQHIIQAFAPGETDAKTAHEIGRKLVMELTNGEHEFVLATHVDKNHIHNHIVFNQVSFVDHKKFRQNIETFKKMQTISDTLCKSYGLSVIENKEKIGKSYYEYNNLRTNNSNRQVLKNTIDSCIPLVENVDQLFEMLKKMGYEIKVTNKNISIKKDTDLRFIRLKNLGDKYQVDALSLRIKYSYTNASPHIKTKNEEVGLLSSLKNKMDQIKSPAYQNAVALSDVKRIAATYAFLNTHNITSVSMIEEAQSKWSLSIKEKHSSIKSMEDELKFRREIKDALLKKEKYNDVYAAYLKTNKSQKFKDEHTAEIMFFESAVKTLSLNKVSPEVKSSDYIKAFDELTAKKDALLDSYHTDVSNLKQLNIAAKNLELIMSDKEVKKQKVNKKSLSRDV